MTTLVGTEILEVTGKSGGGPAATKEVVTVQDIATFSGSGGASILVESGSASKISALTAGTTLAGTETIPMVQGAATVSTTPADILTYTNTNLGVVSGAHGGTGVANTGKTITLAGNLVTTGAFNTTFAQTATSTLTTSGVNGTIAQTSGANLFTSDVYRTSAAVTANNTVTPATVTGLSGTVAIGTYTFRAVLPSTVASGTGGIAYNFLLTTAVLSAIQYGATMSTASALQYTQGTTTASGTVIATQAAVVLQTIIEGTFVVSTGGTFAIQMAQNTANSSNTVALVGGSLELCRIA